MISATRARLGLAIGAAIAISACGETAVHGARASRWDPSGGPPPCASLPVGAYRSCVNDGQPFPGARIPVAQRGRAVGTSDLTARIVRVAVSPLSPEPSAFGLPLARARGRFIVVTLSVTDTDPPWLGPETFYEGTPGQVALMEGKRMLMPSDAADEADAKSFLNGRDFARRGDTRTGDVIFDVPVSDVQRILSHDAIALTGFGQPLDPASYGLLKLG